MRGSRILIALVLSATTLLSARANSVSLSGDEAVGSLRWKAPVIRIAISVSLLRESPNIKRDSDVAGALSRSIDAWSRVTNVEILQTTTEKLSASPSGPSGDGVNLVTVAPTAENVLLFAKDPENAAATTRIFYSRRGVISEADIVLNPYQQFSTDGTPGTFDLESTLTHEIGHLLGLPHSLVLGSTMHENYGKNGVFGLQNVSARSLSADDTASIRALYGTRDDTECCGVIDGRVLAVNRSPKGAQVWIEDLAGRVHGSTAVLSDGSFRFAGLLAGKYRLFGQDTGRLRWSIPAQEIGEVTVAGSQITTLNAKLNSNVRAFELNYVGLNGQLAEMALGFSSGRSYFLFLGGQNLDPERISVSFSTPDITAVPGSLRSHNYGDALSVVSLEIRVARGLTLGEYSVFVSSERGDRRAVVGALTVENTDNSLLGLLPQED